MPSSYTPSLRLTLPATGELSGQWGNTVNTGITELLDAAVAGTATISSWGGAGVSYTLSNNSGTADEARKMFIVATGSPGEAKNVICPAVSKFYVFRNDTTGGYALTLKTPTGTGISVPAGQYRFLYCDGTNVVETFNSVAALTVIGALNAGTIAATTLDLTNLEVTNIKAKDGTASASIADSTGAFTVSAAFAANGNTTLGDAVGDLVTVNGTTTFVNANPTLSAGTANGVLYLNGSKVATSGSALTFDGTRLYVNGAQSLGSTQGTVQSVGSFLAYGDATGLRLLNTANNGGGSVVSVTGANGGIALSGDAGPIAFSAGGTEQMRLTSTGLGIGTSSPGASIQTGDGSQASREIRISTLSGAGQGGFLRGYRGGNPSFYVGDSAPISGGSAGGMTLFAYGATSVDTYTNGILRSTIDSSGNLGIGTSSPQRKLHVNATPGATYGDVARFESNGSAGPVTLSFGDSGTSLALPTIGGNGNSLVFGTSASTQMTLDSSGNLGLGVTPSAWGTGWVAAQVAGGGAALAGRSTNPEVYLTANAHYNGTNWLYKTSTVATQYSQDTGVHKWWVAPTGTAGNAISFTQTMTLDASGNLGVGTTSPGARLDLSDSVGRVMLNGSQISWNRNPNTGTIPDTAKGSALIISDVTGGGVIQFWTSSGVNASGLAERARITSGGEFVIGGTSASSGFPLTLDKSTGGGLVLKHNGTDKAYFFLNGSTVSRWETVTGATIQVSSGNSNGVSLANGATSWAAISDVRLKTDLVPIQDAVNKVSSIRAVTGRFNTDDVGTSRAFLIAQDVQAVLPEAVDVADDEIKTLGLRYTDTIPLLVAAIKEQQALITALTARVAALEAA